MRLISIFLLAWGTSLVAQDTLTVDRLDYRFITYENGLFSPLVSLESAEVASVFVTCQESLQMELCGSQPFNIWVDGRLIRQKRDRACLYLSTDELCRVANRDTVFLTVVSNEKLQDLQARTFRVAKKYGLSEFSLMRRSPLGEFWYFGFIVGLGLIVMARMLVPDFWRFRWPNLEQYNYRLSSLDNWILVVLCSLLLAFSWSFLVDDRSIPLFFGTTGFLLLVFILKFCLIVLSASLFGFWKPTAWQFTFFVRFSFFWSVVAFIILLMLLVFFNLQHFNQAIFEACAAGLLSLFILVVSYILMSQQGTKSLHIFIYLCTVEILPMGLVIFWFLK